LHKIQVCIIYYVKDKPFWLSLKFKKVETNKIDNKPQAPTQYTLSRVIAKTRDTAAV